MTIEQEIQHLMDKAKRARQNAAEFTVEAEAYEARAEQLKALAGKEEK